MFCRPYSRYRAEKTHKLINITGEKSNRRKVNRAKSEKTQGRKANAKCKDIMDVIHYFKMERRFGKKPAMI